MGWTFKWVSSYESDFNFDYHVSYTDEQIKGQIEYNYKQIPGMMKEWPGMSVFAKDLKGDIYHTYSCFSRGLDLLNGAYNILDLTPKGRDETHGPGTFTMSWVRRHNEYEDEPQKDHEETKNNGKGKSKKVKVGPPVKKNEKKEEAESNAEVKREGRTRRKRAEVEDKLDDEVEKSKGKEKQVKKSTRKK